jgi:phage repressor protein C with HTH and peptisase S24 domain
MKEPHQRLQKARAQFFDSASAAAEALNIANATYTQHENGKRGFKLHAERYARFFRVNLEWLLTGRGSMRGYQPAIPIMGIASAGMDTLPIEDPAGAGVIDHVELPAAGELAALIVKGDSMYPRFMNGETLLYDPTPISPEKLIGHYAVAQTMDGRVMIKKIMRSQAPGKHTLWSHNKTEHDVEILTCFKVYGVLL